VSTATKTRPASLSAPPKDGMPAMMAYLTRVLKTPTIGRVLARAGRPGPRRELVARGVPGRRAATPGRRPGVQGHHHAHPHRPLPRHQTLEDFNLDHLPSLRRDVLAHLATGTFVAKAESVILLGPPGLGKTHLAIGLGIKAAHAGYSVLFDTASNWITRLAGAHQAGLDAELKKIRRYKLIVVDLCRTWDADPAPTVGAAILAAVGSALSWPLGGSAQSQPFQEMPAAGRLAGSGPVVRRAVW